MKLKKVIIVLLIIVTVLSGILLILLKNRQLSNKHNNYEIEPPSEIPIEIEKNIKIVDVRSRYYIAQTCVKKFYTNYSEIYKDPLEGYKIKPDLDTVDIESIKRDRIEKVYKMLDEEYIKYKNITLDNLEKVLPKIGEIDIIIDNMKIIEKDINISVYFINGILTNESDSEITNFSIMLKLDSRNKTFKLLLGDYVEVYYKDIKVGDVIEINEQEIQNDTYNVYTHRNIEDEEYIKDLFTHYKKQLKLKKEKSYNLLDEEYKKYNFESINDYLSYIDENYSRIITANIEGYNKNRNSEYTQYIFKDTNGNYYIFKETAPFQYTVMLDNYTIPTEDFIENYNSSKDEEKVVLNIKKFFMGIDDKNYGYSYNLLAESFRNNKYLTKNDFINYVKGNLFDKNEIEYLSYTKETGVYIYKIKVSDATGKSTEIKQFNMIIRLKEGTDFEMSFSEN